MITEERKAYLDGEYDVKVGAYLDAGETENRPSAVEISKQAEWMCTLDERLIEHIGEDSLSSSHLLEGTINFDASKRRTEERLRMLTFAGVVALVYDGADQHECTGSDQTLPHAAPPFSAKEITRREGWASIECLRSSERGVCSKGGIVRNWVAGEVCASFSLG